MHYTVCTTQRSDVDVCHACDSYECLTVIPFHNDIKKPFKFNKFAEIKGVFNVVKGWLIVSRNSLFLKLR